MAFPTRPCYTWRARGTAPCAWTWRMATLGEREEMPLWCHSIT